MAKGKLLASLRDAAKLANMCMIEASLKQMLLTPNTLILKINYQKLAIYGLLSQYKLAETLKLFIKNVDKSIFGGLHEIWN